MTDKQRILVVDDEQNIRELVATALKFSGYDVADAADGVTALNRVGEFNPHLVVLDVSMPGFDGFEVLRRLRQAGDETPVIFLTARDAAEDMLTGFEGGGDDYLTKPFGLDELVARVRAVLKRSVPAPAEPDDAKLTYADLTLDESAHRVERAGAAIDLSPTEYRLLRYLLHNPERVLSKSQILEHVWQYDFDGDASVVEVYISYLRKKIDAVDPKLIHTVRGFGYTLRVDS